MHRDQHIGMQCSVEEPRAGDLAAIINTAGDASLSHPESGGIRVFR